MHSRSFTIDRALRAAACAAFLMGALAGCGGVDDVDATVGTLEPVRGAVEVAEERAAPIARVAAGQAIAVAEAALARLRLDSGPRLLLDAGSRIEAKEAGLLALAAGRAFVEVAPGESLTIETERGAVRAEDAALSIRIANGATELYVVRGEVSFRAGDARGVVRAGERIALGQGAPRAEAAALWDDWTGGLARPGLAEEPAPTGMGVLEARVPDEVGLARWPLVVRRLDVRVKIEGDLAITEVEQVFFNPASDTVEGLYRLRVPEGAVLQRFAVDRGGRLVDAYVREKEQARQAYDVQVYRGSTEDPALLEWDAPGAYRARIYPIAPGSVRRIAVRWAEWLSRPAAGAPRMYRYPMGGSARAPHVQELSFVADLSEASATRVRAGHGALVEEGRVVLRQSDVRPRSDLWMELVDDEGPETQAAWRADHVPPARAPGAPPPADERDERDYWMLPLVLPADIAGEGAQRGVDLVIVADVSAGTDASHLELGRTVVESITAQLGERDRVAIVASDLALRPVGERRAALGPASRDRVEALLDALARVPAGGATDLGAAIAQAADMLDPSRPSAIVYVGDATPTVGELGAGELIERIARLPHPVRLYGVAVGARADLELLEALTRGGGLAMRVEERAAAADAALRIIAHAGRPLAQRVTVELGDGIDQAFPRKPTDVVLGDVLTVVGRVRGSVPSAVTVKGTFAGRAFERRLEVETTDVEDSGDLRLRWAGERLRQLLLDGAGREAVAELGTRYGIITPFTSYYVPSASELARMGETARALDHEALFDARVASSRPWLESAGQIAAAIALAPLTLGGCTLDRAEAPASEAQQSGPARLEESGDMAPPPPGQPAGTTAATPVAAAEVPAEPSPQPVAPEPADDEARAANADIARDLAALGYADRRTTTGAAVDGSENAGYVGALGGGEGQAGDVVAEARGAGGLGVLGTGSGGGGTDQGFGFGRAGGGVAGEQQPLARNEHTTPRPMPSRRARIARDPRGGERDGDDRDAEEEGERAHGGRYRRGAEIDDLGVRVTVEVGPLHRPQRCSDAAGSLLEDRRALWRERLGRQSMPGGWVDAYRDAIRTCEAPNWRDRRALLELVLARAGSIARMVEVYQILDDASGRGYLRHAILRRVRTPEDLRIVRDAFGLTAAVDWNLVEQLLARATSPEERVRVLRRLIADRTYSFDLKLRLLEELERLGRTAEARRLADDMRMDPLADAGVRTAIGEMFIRLGDEQEARRVFSEIVEFAPNDELARRRLGDLYRAHGWFHDAYRQYQTLASIRPDDPTVLLLLAQAAAGSGRVDEALRLEQRLAETAEPGAASGVARTALLWSSVRFAELRKRARDADDHEKLRALVARMRRSGVLREAGDLRVSLVWSHPDAMLSLWAGHPGLGLTRPTDITPELGIEAFDVREQEGGTYKLEVRRAGRDHLTRVDAKLVVVWKEGTNEERIEVVPLRFERDRRAFAWTLSGTTLAEAAPSPEATGGAR